MSDLFDGIESFVQVARAGSFRGAAKTLGVTPAAVSKAVQRLELRLGVALFQRTTRRVSLTVEGGLYLERCSEAMAQVYAGREVLAMHRERAQGNVTLTMPHILGRYVMQRLGAFACRYPSLKLHLRFTDRYVNLVEEQSDVALRMGALEDSAMIARFLHQTQWCLVASPAYLAQRGTPTHTDDLASHKCIKFMGTNGKVVEWFFLQPKSKETMVLKTPTALDVDQGEMLLEAAIAGMGICQAFRYLVEGPIQEGKLVPLLEEHAAPGLPIHALCMAGQQHNPRIRAVLDFLVEIFATLQTQ